jgi:hypothetical protein
MDRTERHAFLERLIAMRADYRAVGDEQRGVLSIADAVLYAEAVMAAVASDAEPWLVELAGTDGDGTTDAAGARGLAVAAFVVALREQSRGRRRLSVRRPPGDHARSRSGPSSGRVGR